jgi:aldehyde dehydrogenase (NAD+)
MAGSHSTRLLESQHSQSGIDHQRKIILPHIIEIDTVESVREHFAPIFCLHRFQSVDDLLDLLDSDERINQHSMYLTYFGKRRNISSTTAVVLYNQTVLDIEDGNRPFGGFGTRANFVRYDMNTKSYPIHIPSAIDEYITKNSFLVASSNLGKTNSS